MSGPRVTAVVVTYRSARTIEACLAALRRCRDARLLECVVVDNSSPDNTRELLRAHEPWATVVDSGGNLGFGRGCNVGLSRATTEYVVFVNPDAELEPVTLEKLVAFGDAHPRAGMIAPAIREPDGTMQDAGGLPSPLSVVRASWPGHRSRERRPIEAGAAARRVDWLCGALFLSRTKLLNELGGFDPRFFLYWEETDLCKRIAMAGHELWAVGEAVAAHVGGASTLVDPKAPRYAGSIPEHYFQSRFYYLKKHHGLLAAWFVEVAEFLLAILNSMRYRTAVPLRARMAGPFFQCPPERAT